jgi:outer membrane protein OmpA-like peptidoglycan-associated protein
MKTIVYLTIFASAASLMGCAANLAPPGLINARQACAHASATPGTLLVPAEMRKAHEALANAEKSFLDNPGSHRTQDLASQAYQLATRAELLARIATDALIAARAEATYEVVQNARSLSLGKYRNAEQPGGNRTSGQPATARPLALNAMTHLKSNLERLTTVTEDDRGLVCTLSGDVTFREDKSTLTRVSQHLLGQVARVLMADREPNLAVEDHTDSQGSSNRRNALSQRRADVVRSYIVGCGYPSHLIVAKGIGINKPVSDNVSVEGRAKNRRVEIIVARVDR